MKRWCLTLFACLALAVPLLAFAQEDFRADTYSQTRAFAGEQGADYGTPRDPRLVVAYTIQILLSVVGILFLGYTVFAGYTIMMARGDEAEITKGKETLKTAVIGLVIIFSSYSITLFVAGVALSSSGRCYRTSILSLLKGQNAIKQVSCAEMDKQNDPNTGDDFKFEWNGVEVDGEFQEDHTRFIQKDSMQ